VSAPDTKQADTINPDFTECPPKCPPNSEAGPDVKADTKDGADTILDKASHTVVLQELGMTVEKALALWTKEGRPIIHLGPGENCFDLKKMLSRRDINERHLAAVREWLVERQR